MRYFFQIAYKGTAYRGWQRQINVPTVQEVMEQVLSQLLKRPITCIGCGRTDAGVHASQYFFHIDYEASLPENLLFLLQKNLPGDIVVYQIFLMEGWPHAQFDAVERTYRYYLHTQVNPFWQDLSAFYPIDLSVPLLQKALDLLPQYQDYRAFCKTPDRHASTLCQVNFAHLASDVEQTYFCIELRANRFLKSMVRLLVGQLLEVGMGNFSLVAFERCLKEGTPPPFPKVAYAQGLYLAGVKYKMGFGPLKYASETHLPFLPKHADYYSRDDQ